MSCVKVVYRKFHATHEYTLCRRVHQTNLLRRFYMNDRSSVYEIHPLNNGDIYDHSI